MTDESMNFLTRKHQQLLRVASIANLFSWLALLLYLAQGILSSIDYIEYLGYFDEEDLFRDFILLTADNVLAILNKLVVGIAFWLILRGISLGLKMIVETDLNYRGATQEQDNE